MTKNTLAALFILLSGMIYGQQQEVSANKAVPQKTDRTKTADENSHTPVSSMAKAQHPKPVKRPATISTEITPRKKAEK